MNPDTGKPYLGVAAMLAASGRGERLVPVAERAARRIRDARGALARKLQASRRKKKARRRDRIAKASRRANR